jgi:hypothetical protein
MVSTAGEVRVRMSGPIGLRLRAPPVRIDCRPAHCFAWLFL